MHEYLHFADLLIHRFYPAKCDLDTSTNGFVILLAFAKINRNHGPKVFRQPRGVSQVVTDAYDQRSCPGKPDDAIKYNAFFGILTPKHGQLNYLI
jgi:hypothetical protein